MGKKKPHMSLFSTIVQQINDHDRTKIPSNEYHLIDNEYFAAFNSLDDIQQFHNKLIDKQQEQSNGLDQDGDLRLEEDNNDMDMKSFAQQFLIDSPEPITKVMDNLSLSRTSSQDLFTTDQPINWSPRVKIDKNLPQLPENKKRKSSTPVKLNIETTSKRQRRHIRDLPRSSEFIFMSDNDHQNRVNTSTNIFDSLQTEQLSSEIAYENMSSILCTLSDTQPMNHERSTSVELPESLTIKNEPIETEQVIVEAKEEPVEINMTSIEFGTSDFSGDLDNYVQNIHRLRQPSHIDEPNSVVSSRPKRIRKRKKFYIEESELPTRSKKVRTPIRNKRPSLQMPSTLHLTDAEIEQQFGELLPTVKTEHDEGIQQTVNSHIVIEFEPVAPSPQTPIEKARAKLTAALGRGHDPDTYLLKIRSREHKIIEVQLAIYGTADWHTQRTKILSKIEEALRGLRVSWTKIDIIVDDFDVQISTLSQAASISPLPPSSTNSSWFLKTLSESGPLIVHIHDRRYPQQRLLIKCACPECSPISTEHSIEYTTSNSSINLSSSKHSFSSSLPVIVNVSPATTPTRRLTTPTILNKTQATNISSLHNIDTTFFNELIYQWGRTIVISVTQCVLDLALIVSVHASLPTLCVLPNYSKEEYKQNYQQIIDPLKRTLNDNEKILLNQTSMIARVVSVNSINNTQSIVLSQPPNILTFYESIKQNKANIRSAKSMRNLITRSFSTPVSSPSPIAQSNVLKPRTLILPKPTTGLSLLNSQTLINLPGLKPLSEQNRRSGRRSSQTNRYDKYIRTYSDTHEPKQQALCTPIIELKPIMGGSTITTQNIHSFTRENSETIIVRDSQNNELKKVTTVIPASSGVNEAQLVTDEVNPSSNSTARVIRFSIAKSALPNIQPQLSSTSLTSPPTIRLVASPKTNFLHSTLSTGNTGESVPLVPKQINIIKPFASSTPIAPAIKLSNPVLISAKPQQPSTK